MKPLGSARSGAARLADGALELTVAGGLGSPGIRLRRRMFSWEQLPGMQGRRVLITRATSGIGRATALQMAGVDAEVAIIGRDPERTRNTAQEIAEVGAGPRNGAGYFLADLRLLSDARRVADEIIAEGQVWDVLIHNAGALVRTYERTAEGFEATYASQVLSQHVLTTRLLPVLARGTDPRVIVVSSGGMYAEKLDLDTVQMSADGYDGVRAYARAKRAQVALNQQWAARLSASGVEFHCMHPGWADTPGVQDALPAFRRVTQAILRTPQEGADTCVWLAASTTLPAPSGTFWLDRRPRGTVRVPGTSPDPADGARLWELVCEQTGERPPGDT